MIAVAATGAVLASGSAWAATGPLSTSTSSQQRPPYTPPQYPPRGGVPTSTPGPPPHSPDFLNKLPPDKRAYFEKPFTPYSGPPLNNSVPVCGGAPSCRPEGIFPGGELPSAGSFATQNHWVGTLHAVNVVVYAGQELTISSSGAIVPGQGGIRVDTGNPPIQNYPAPGPAEPLTIVSVNGTVLKLQRRDGSTLTFDLATHIYG